MSDTIRSAAFQRAVCFILFLASVLLYANRVTFTQNKPGFEERFHATAKEYGHAERLFNYGFAFGGLIFGMIADAVSIRWLYPLVLLVWSLAGAMSGVVSSLEAYGACRLVLGLFEAAHWPCALRMTQRTFLPADRAWGNGILQSGASVGQVLTPWLIIAFAGTAEHWRMPYLIVGLLGIPWALLWWSTVREDDVQRPVIQAREEPSGQEHLQEIQEPGLLSIFLGRRYWILLFLVLSINVPWHCLRVWMPDSLQSVHGYTKLATDSFSSLYYLAACVGSIAAGWLPAQLISRGMAIRTARLTAFLIFSLAVALLVPAVWIPSGPYLLTALMFVAAGSLGLSPLYYTLTQELSGKNQGKVGGSLSFCNWMVIGFLQAEMGSRVKNDPTIHPWIFAGVGILPLIGWLVLVTCWRNAPRADSSAAH